MSWLCGDIVNCEQNISFSNLVGDYIKGEGTYNGNLQYIIDSGTKYTFHEIKKQVEKLAKKLVNYKKIAIIMKVSIEFIVTLLAAIINKITYIPIEPTAPNERIEYIIDSSDPEIIIVSDTGTFAQLNYKNNIQIFSFKELFSIEDIETKEKNVEHDFCIMFTSGSTGKPKGVRISHEALLNRLYWQWNEFPFGEDDICCCKTSIAFVDSITETLVPLLLNIPIILIEKSVLSSPEQLFNILINYQGRSSLLHISDFVKSKP